MARVSPRSVTAPRSLHQCRACISEHFSAAVKPTARPEMGGGFINRRRNLPGTQFVWKIWKWCFILASKMLEMLCRSKRCWWMVCVSSLAPLGTAPPDLQSFCCRLSPQHPSPCHHPPLEPFVTLTLPPGDAGAGLQHVTAPNGQWQRKPLRGPRVVTIDQAAPPTSGRHRPPPASHLGFASCSCTAFEV